MTDDKALEAAVIAFNRVLLNQPDDCRDQPAAMQAAIRAYLAALEANGRAIVRVERVNGDSINEFRANISPEFYRTGDCVLAWVNEADLTNSEMRAMIAAAKE